MTAEQFWEDDPQLFGAYRISFLNKKKEEQKEIDYKCWLLGLYIYDGNIKLTARMQQFLGNIVAGFSKSPHYDKTKIDGYPEKPYSELEAKKINEKQDRYQKMQENIMVFGSIKKIYSERMNKEKK